MIPCHIVVFGNLRCDSDSVPIFPVSSVPSSVAEVEADPLDPFSIRLTWQSPKKPNGIITHYVIAYNDNRGSPEEEWIKVQQNGKWHRELGRTSMLLRHQAETRSGH